MADETDVSQTPDDLSTTDTTAPDTSGDLFSSITNGVVTLAGAAQTVVKGFNSPVPNNTPSNIPSTVPTTPPAKTSTFAGWSTAKKVGVGIAAGVLGLLALLGLSKLFKS